MPDRIVFWSVALFCASFYFNWTIEGLMLLGERDAAVVNLAAATAVTVPSLAVLIRDLWGMFGRRG